MSTTFYGQFSTRDAPRAHARICNSNACLRACARARVKLVSRGVVGVALFCTARTKGEVLLGGLRAGDSAARGLMRERDAGGERFVWDALARGFGRRMVTWSVLLFNAPLGWALCTWLVNAVFFFFQRSDGCLMILLFSTDGVA